ncbi:unnamed protein product [Blepharisma stoltei]|uniref:RING-type domain-containing protein n=1 Tax=Blepharisma stoltei TaxID=1481888 RepID=A0AAU9K4E3_9CILI|nr:unnamed protein product [Blepharisma stoltei]
MNWKKKLSLFGVIGGILSYDVVLICYLAMAKFEEPMIMLFSDIFFALSFIANPLLLALITKYTSEFYGTKYISRLFLFFPLSLFFTNTFLALHPIIMQKLLRFMGVRDYSIILYSIIFLYMGKLCSTGVLDVFCQALIIGNNISASGNITPLDLIYIVAVIIAGLILFSLSLFCCADIIGEYLEQYSEQNSIRETLITPNFIEYTKNRKEEVCNICLDEFKEGDRMGEMPNCEHAFHQECLMKWLEYKSMCPICRNQE